MGHSFVASLPSSRCAAVARDRVNLCTIVFESEKCISEPCHRVKRRNCVVVAVPLIRRLKCIADRKMTYIVRLVVVCVLVGLIDSNPAVDSGGVVNHLEPEHGTLSKAALEDSFIRRLGGKCTQKDNSSCVMLKLVTYMNRMLKKSSINLGDSFELMKTRSDEQLSDTDAEEISVLGRATTSDDHKLSVMVADKIWRFIHSRSLRWRATRATDVVVASGESGKLNLGVSLDTRRLFEEGRGRLKQYAPILAAVVMKAVLIGALVLKGIALLVGKALLVSKLALVLASILGIKKLLHKKYVTYEVVAHPPEPHHHVDTYSSGWARALDGFVESFSNELNRRLTVDAHDMAYQQQAPAHQQKH